MEKFKKNSGASCCGKSKLAIVCYVIAALLLIVAVYMLVVNVRYLSSYAEMYGMSVTDMMSDLIQYSISGFVPYFTYAVLVFGMGRIMQFIFCCGVVASCCEAPAEITEQPADTCCCGAEEALEAAVPEQEAAAEEKPAEAEAASEE